MLSIYIDEKDYYPFGMVTPGRSYSAGSVYRFGFNGKESDAETYGSSNIYDYGFRIYNPRLGKFLSVDPLASSYPDLTPYQYGSNRPIDGVDLDGLEWIHYYVYLDQKGKFLYKVVAEDFRNKTAQEMEKIHGINGEVFYQTYSKGFGKEGRGVKYTYMIQTEDGSYVQYGDPRWEVKDDNSVSRFGLYGGKGSVTNQGPRFKAGYMKYDFSLLPNDMADAIARQHDMAENEPNYKSWKNLRYILDDIEFVRSMEIFMESVDNGTLPIDPYTGRPASSEAYKAASNAAIFFRIQISNKMNKLVGKWHAGKISDEEYRYYLQKIDEAWKINYTLPTPQKDGK